MANTNGRRIYLSLDCWWHEVDLSGFPREIVQLLRGIISTKLKDAIPPEATPPLVHLAKEHLSGGLSMGSIFYDVMVYVPEDSVGGRSFFVLVPSYPGGELKRLSEL